jgi:hypothetical protein
MELFNQFVSNLVTLFGTFIYSVINLTVTGCALHYCNISMLTSRQSILLLSHVAIPPPAL